MVYSSEARVVGAGVGEALFGISEELYVYTHMLTRGRVGWLRGLGNGNRDQEEEQAVASGYGRSRVHRLPSVVLGL